MGGNRTARAGHKDLLKGNLFPYKLDNLVHKLGVTARVGYENAVKLNILIVEYFILNILL